MGQFRHNGNSASSPFRPAQRVPRTTGVPCLLETSTSRSEREGLQATGGMDGPLRVPAPGAEPDRAEKIKPQLGNWWRSVSPPASCHGRDVAYRPGSCQGLAVDVRAAVPNRLAIGIAPSLLGRRPVDRLEGLSKAAAEELRCLNGVTVSSALARTSPVATCDCFSSAFKSPASPGFSLPTIWSPSANGRAKCQRLRTPTSAAHPSSSGTELRKARCLAPRAR